MTERGVTVRVKTARGRKRSSVKWLQRQLNDPYVAKAKIAGYRSRAAFKLTELNERFGFLKSGATVVDLGAAPGGWTQVAVEIAGPGTPEGSAVVGIDILPWDTVAGADCLTMDFLDPAAPEALRTALGGRLPDVVLSDMAPSTTGHGPTDHVRIVGLCEAAWQFAKEVLAPGGAFVCKVFQGGAEGDLLQEVKASFAEVRHAKPPASRKESPEVYLVATGFRAPGDSPADGSSEKA